MKRNFKTEFGESIQLVDNKKHEKYLGKLRRDQRGRNSREHGSPKDEEPQIEKKVVNIREFL